VSAACQVGLAVGAWALACWPLWGWYAGRVLGLPDQGWIVLAPVAAIALSLRRWRDPLSDPSPGRWVPSILWMGLYAALFSRLPMTLAAVPAAAALLFIPGPWRRGFWPAAPVAGLLVLGLPALFMVQFYFGFPLQMAAAALAVPVLKLAGFPVAREGALLMLDGKGVGVDAACNGIRMGWAALFMALTLAGLSGLGWRRTAAAAAGALVLVVLVNALRVAILFSLDVFGLGGRPVLHAGIGVMLFIALAAGLAGWVRRLAGRRA
jgi:exosortase/archaeosortase family protein